jgi:hypothetical protein
MAIVYACAMRFAIGDRSNVRWPWFNGTEGAVMAP